MGARLRSPGTVAFGASLGALLLPVAALAVFLESRSVLELPTYLVGVAALGLAFALVVRRCDTSGAAVVVASLAAIPQCLALMWLIAVAAFGDSKLWSTSGTRCSLGHIKSDVSLPTRHTNDTRTERSAGATEGGPTCQAYPMR